MHVQFSCTQCIWLNASCSRSSFYQHQHGDFKVKLWRYKCEVQRPNFKFIFFVRFVLFTFFFIFLYFCTFVLLYFCTFCTFVLSHLVGRCIWTFMQNLESVALKMTELWVLLYLCTFLYFFVLFVLLYFCNLFGLSIRTSMQNLESVAQKMAELLH